MILDSIIQWFLLIFASLSGINFMSNASQGIFRGSTISNKCNLNLLSKMSFKFLILNKIDIIKIVRGLLKKSISSNFGIVKPF